MAQTFLDRDRSDLTTAREQGEKLDEFLFRYLVFLLGDHGVAREVTEQICSMTYAAGSLQRDGWMQPLRAAATHAVELSRTQALTGRIPSAPLQERALKWMPAPQYRALMLYAHTGASYEEIGEREGIAEGTAHTRVCRAKRWLWEFLPSKLCEHTAHETDLYPFLVCYLNRLLTEKQQAERVAATTINMILRQRVCLWRTPYERTRQFYLVATNLVIDILHQQSRGEIFYKQGQLFLQLDAIEGMPNRLRQALLLYIQDGVDYASIGVRENVTPATASVRVSLARTWIREHLVLPDELVLAVTTVEWTEKRRSPNGTLLSSEEVPDVEPDSNENHTRKPLLLKENFHDTPDIQTKRTVPAPTGETLSLDRG